MGENIYKKVHELLLTGQRIVLARTIRRSGSAPRDVGSMCIITEQGELIGTVGGGILEYRVQEKARTLLKQGKSFIYRFKLSNEDLARNGMICGGNVDLYLEGLFPSNTGMVSLFKTIHSHIIDNKGGILVTRIEDGINAMDTGARLFISDNGKISGNIPGLDPGTISLDKDVPYDLTASGDKKTDLFLERIVINSGIFLFGAGHVSFFVAKLAKTVGFKITVLDDRPEFANKQKFPEADEIIVTDFKKAFEQVNIPQNSYILIITRGHLHDKTVLEQALLSRASYIGMIGSIKKRNIIYKDLMDKGFSKETLEKVYSPVGLDINAETPEEIAVSIVGELIKKRAPERKKQNLIL
ncbi:MAG: XdhC family protein [Deltaproteobacteria bacterium]|nr:XdhC family protein [Deltaproteobacteria bacterium]